MINLYYQKRYLPYLVGVIGLGLTLCVWYLESRFDLFAIIHTLHPWIDLISGIGFSVSIAIMVRFAQLAKSRAITLKKTNENLKKETAERLSVEDSKQKLEIALLQGQKLQAIGTLAGGIAHDFNNILYAIIGYVELSREDVAKNTLTYKNLGKVLEATHRGQELIGRILAFSRRQHHQFEVIDLTRTIEAALGLLRPTIPASVSIQLQQGLHAMILGNQTQIHQVLVNLINNAVDAMDGEGTITIHLSSLSADDPFLKQFPATLKQNYCKIDITDTGAGMDQPTMERMFEPFFTTKEVGKGTGLGLSIVHSIIKEHQGEITVKSQLGTGTTFMILLPEISQA